MIPPVALIGAGPGDPGLITVRGLELLRRAEVVLYDALAHPALLDECVGAELVNVGKRYGEDSVPQAEITAAIVAHARAGKRVVRLKGGDPFLFARGSEEAEALVAAGLPFEVVPGVTSPVAASAYAGVSLTHRELSSSVTFITGHQREGVDWSPEQWKKLATATDTICVLMGMKRLEAIAQALVDGGRAASTPAMVVQWGARPQQRVVESTLGEVAQTARKAGLKNPGIVIVGEVVALRASLRWFDARPLFGRRVLVPRAAEQAAETAKALRERGAEPILAPLIELRDPPDPGPLRRAVAELRSYDWVVFTSVNGVERCFAEVARQGRDARAFGAARVAAIGPKTAAAIERHGVVPDLIAKEFVAEALVSGLLAQGPAQRVLVPRALVARELLPQALRAQGIHVDVAPAYATRPLDAERARTLRERIERHELDVVLFTSSSTVDALCDTLGETAAELLSGVTVACIGPITAATAARRGLGIDVTAERYTVDGLLDALEAHFTAR